MGDSPNVPRVGAEIAGYRLESVLQRGGMSVVYAAEHIRMKRRVALKILATELADDDRFRERFLNESRMAASIDHPNIVPIYDAGEENGVLYIAMHYVAGSDLKALIAREAPLEIGRCVSIMVQIGGALGAAHARGLIHRDIKPGNILVVLRPGPDSPDHIYLSDFGLTKHNESHSALTPTGQFLGTVDYVAPEQIEGNPVDARADIYSLGCVFCELLTGIAPFVKDDDVATLWAHLQQEAPRVSEQRPDVPTAFDEVVATALAKSPDDRYDGCRAFVSAIRAAATAPHVALAGEPTRPAQNLTPAPAAPAPPRDDVAADPAPPTSPPREQPSQTQPPARETQPPLEQPSQVTRASEQPSPTEPPAQDTQPPAEAPSQVTRPPLEQPSQVTQPPREPAPQDTAPPLEPPSQETRPPVPAEQPAVAAAPATPGGGSVPPTGAAAAAAQGAPPGDGWLRRHRTPVAVLLLLIVVAVPVAVILLGSSSEEPSKGVADSAKPTGQPVAGGLAPVPTNRVTGTGKVTMRLNGNVATVAVTTSGLLDGSPHPLHIHAGSKRGVCPPSSAARPHNGHLTISTLDGVPFYGSPVTSLTTTGGTSAKSILALNRFPRTGSIRYTRRIDLTPVVASYVRANNAVIVVHGTDYNHNGIYDNNLDRSDLNRSLPGELTTPALCGKLVPQQQPKQGSAGQKTAQTHVYYASLGKSDPGNGTGGGSGLGANLWICHLGDAADAADAAAASA
jgi:serine/threonine protein kinase